MNIIKKIKIDNIKKFRTKEWNFENLTANQPNLIVAPNGYGKSTIATAFRAAKSGKMKLKTNELYKGFSSNIPRLEVEFCGSFSKKLVSDDSRSEISKNIFIYTVDNPLCAKGTTNIAYLGVKNIVVYNKIPKEKELNYDFESFISAYNERESLFIDINPMFRNRTNLYILLDIEDEMKKCIKGIEGREIAKKIKKFINSCNIDEIVNNEFDIDSAYNFFDGEYIIKVFQAVGKMKDKPNNWSDKDIIFTAFQLIELFKNTFSIKELKDSYEYLKFRYYKNILNERLSKFNTTGRTIEVKEKQEKLVITLPKPSSMSNGERDVLYFISNLTKFELDFQKEVGILVIDEVFDYLDGSNMLAVQYFLNELIDKCKLENKILFPLIFTHLDPDIFSNYYFSKKKVHYISIFGNFDDNSELVKLLILRSDSSIDNMQREEIEKYYIHYNNTNHTLSEELLNRIGNGCIESSNDFRKKLYYEVELKYLNEKEQEYDPLKVIAALRIRIEENVYNLLSDEHKRKFLEIHTVKKKLDFAVDSGYCIPEYYYLLQPLYNDGLHVTTKTIKNKLKSCYLKTNNLHIKNLISRVFMDGR